MLSLARCLPRGLTSGSSTRALRRTQHASHIQIFIPLQAMLSLARRLLRNLAGGRRLLLHTSPQTDHW